MERVARFFVGIDLHKDSMEVCVLSELAEVVERRRFGIPTLARASAAFEALCRWSEKGRFAVEAVGMNRWLVDACLSRGMDIVVVDPTKLGLKALGKKTDRNDAYEIARRLLLGDIDRNARTYYPTLAEYGARKLIRVRRDLVQRRQGVINQIRALFRAYKRPMPAGRLDAKSAVSWLRTQELASATLTAGLSADVGVLAVMNEEIRSLDRRIKEVAQQLEGVALLRTIPSVHNLSAVTILAELGDIARFRGSRTLAAYAGLAPRVSQSGDRAHHGSITHRGSRELRYILIQLAVRLLMREPLVQQWARPLLKRRHKNKVRIALARRLLVSIRRMLLTGEAFNLERCLNLRIAGTMPNPNLETSRR